MTLVEYGAHDIKPRKVFKLISGTENEATPSSFARQYMKILFVHDKFGAFGGAETNIRITAEVLGPRGHELGIAYMSGTGRDEAAWVQLFDHSWHLGSSPAEKVQSCIDEFEPDVIYVHSISDLELLQACLNSGAPAVRMVHDHDLYCLRSYKYNVLTRNNCMRPVSWRCVFPCMGCVTRDRESKLGMRLKSYVAKKREIALNQHFSKLVVYSRYSKAELVRNGFEPSRVEMVAPMRVEVPEVGASFSGENLVLFAGQLIRGKGVDYLLKSLAKVRAPFRAVIAGEGSHKAKCEALSSNLGLAGKVRFTGYLDREELQELYGRASVFAMSSLWPEPFGMAGPEAMLYGLPVVAFDAGGISEWLHHRQNGLLVPWGDTNAYAAAVTELLMNKDFGKELGKRGCAHVRASYSASVQVGKLENIFLGLTNTRNSGVMRRETVQECAVI